LDFYDKAIQELAGVDFGFDRLWIELKQADSRIHQICTGCYASARVELLHVVSESKQQRLRWVTAEAQTSMGSTTYITSDFNDLRRTLTSAINEFAAIGAAREGDRATGYLSYTYLSASDYELAFHMSNKALQLSSVDDHVRRLQLYQLLAT